MVWLIGVTLFSLAIIVAVVSLWAKDLMTSVVTLTVFSFLMAILYAWFGAPDVALNEAVIGAGISGVFFVITIYYTTRRSRD